MSASANPDIVDDGLVFLYDTDDGKSYKGEPTENIALTEMGISLGQNFSSGQHFCTTSIVNFSQAKYGNGVVWKYAIDRNNDRNWLRPPYSSASGGSTWTFSYWVYNPNSINVTMQARIFGRDSNSTIVTNQASNITCQSLTWTQVYLTTTLAATATQIGFHLELVNEEDFSVNDFVYLDGIQLEEKSHVTQFTTGTRSATQGLIDRTGNSTIDISNASFDSNAQMTFDGTDDYAEVADQNFLDLTTAMSFEFVVKPDSSQSNLYPRLIDKSVYLIHLTSTSPFGIFQNISTSGGLRQTGINSVVTAGNWTHIVCTYDGQYGKIYVDGELVKTQDFGSVLSCNTNSSSLRIAGDGSTNRPLNGEMPICKIYNKVLTASEVLQNFNATKSRFGL